MRGMSPSLPLLDRVAEAADNTCTGVHPAQDHDVATIAMPRRVGMRTFLPYKAGVANRVTAPISTRLSERPVLGSSPCSTPPSVSSVQTRPPPTTGAPVIDAAACH